MSRQIAALTRDGFDLAIRYQSEEAIDAGVELLFGDVVLPVCSPKLMRVPARPKPAACCTSRSSTN